MESKGEKGSSGSSFKQPSLTPGQNTGSAGQAVGLSGNGLQGQTMAMGGAKMK